MHILTSMKTSITSDLIPETQTICLGLAAIPHKHFSNKSTSFFQMSTISKRTESVQQVFGFELVKAQLGFDLIKV